MNDPALYRSRQRRLCSYLAENDTEVGVILDFEGLRNRSLRYLCGHPADGVLFVFAQGRTLLVAWDVPLAESMATVDDLIAYERYGRTELEALRRVLEENKVARAELSQVLPYPLVDRLKRALSAVQLLCREEGIDKTIESMRAIKDREEIERLRKACSITDELLGEIEDLLRKPGSPSELELALHIEAGARKRGAEGMGFETLAASAKRSFAIHCHPSYTAESFGTRGLSILDFGVCFSGYTSDVTLTGIRGPLSRRQQDMAAAVAEAHDLAVSLCRPGEDPAQIAGRVEEFLESRGFHMPHSLGHGIGLDAHEAPLLRLSRTETKQGGQQVLQPGMVFTLEPGVYDPEEGGVRLENDFLCTEQGVEMLSSARLIYL